LKIKLNVQGEKEEDKQLEILYPDVKKIGKETLTVTYFTYPRVSDIGC